MPELEIIGLPQSTYTRAVRIAAAEKGVDYNFTVAPPHSDEVNAIHPFGKVPVMRHGEVELAESKAICDYIDGNFDGPDLLPQDPSEAARAEQWVSLVNTVIDKTLIRDYLFAYLFPSGDDGGPDKTFIAEVLPAVEKQIKFIDTALENSDFLAGDAYSFADMNLLPILSYVQNTPEGGELIGGSTNLLGYLSRCQARDSFQATQPPAQEA